MLRLSTKRTRDTTKTSANTTYARPLPTATAPQAPTVPGLRLVVRATRRRAGMVPGTATATATAMANLLTVRRIHTARRARRPTGATVPAARTVPGLRLAGRAARRLAGVARTATLTTPTAIGAASGSGQRLRRRRCRRPKCKVAGGPGLPPTPPPDAEHTRRADALRAEREATGHDARAAVSLPFLFNLFRLIFFFGLFRFKMNSVFGLQNLLKSLIVPAVLF